MRVPVLILSGFLLACGAPIPAAEPGSKPVGSAVKSSAPVKAPQQEFEKLREEFNQAMRRAAETQLEASASRLFGLLDANPKGDLAQQILRFLLVNQAPLDAAVKQKALKLLTERYAADETVATFLYLASMNPQGGRQLLERIVAVNPDRALQAQSLLQLGQMTLTAINKTPEPAKQKPVLREAEGIFQRVVHQFGDVELPGKPKLARERAEALLKELQLRVGQPFPDLEAQSLAGAKEHIAGYRGKVVVFNVWATWCGPCTAMIPHEREIVESLKGKPFALISVSIDADKAELDRFLKKTSMPWTHWWDANWDGKIGKALNVHSIPTIYVLDANGVIRYKNVHGEALTRAVETCLAEIKKPEKGYRFTPPISVFPVFRKFGNVSRSWQSAIPGQDVRRASASKRA